MIILFPIFCLIGLIIFIDDGSPIIFKQKRIGLNHKPFTIYKFRSLEITKDNEGQEANKCDWNSRVPDDFVFKSSSSSKVTKSGYYLRKYSLDELPQLYNVFKGDMSLVGPRPEIPEITEHYDEIQEQRLLVKPGITGLAQINGRDDITHGEKNNYDLEYVINQCLFLDLKIIYQTIWDVLKGKGAY